MKYLLLSIALAFASVADAQQPIAGPFRNLIHRFQQRFHRQPSPQPSPMPDVNPAPAPDTNPAPNPGPAPSPVAPPTTGICFYVVVPSLTSQGAELAAIERSEAVRTAVASNGFKWLDASTAPKGVLAAAQAVGLPAMLAVDFSLPADKRLVGSAKLVDEKSLIDFIACSTKTAPLPIPPAPIPEPAK